METGDTIFASLGVRSKVITACVYCRPDEKLKVGGQPEKIQAKTKRRIKLFWQIFAPLLFVNLEIDIDCNLHLHYISLIEIQVGKKPLCWIIEQLYDSARTYFIKNG